MRLKIGEFARLGQVSVSALRYYSDAGLLRPAHTDKWTSYRYYDLDQLPALNRILALKDLGLSLDDIRSLMGDEMPAEHLRLMLRIKQSEMKEEARELAERLSRVEARIQQIEMEGKMPDYDVVIKKVGPIRGAMLHDTVSKGVAEAGSYNHFMELAAYLRSHGLTKANVTGPPVDILYDPPDTAQEELRVAVFIPIDRDVPDSERIRMEELPAVEQMVSVVHHGPFATISAAHVAALKWIEQNGYEVRRPNRGIYLQYDREGDPNDYVTEIQYPVEKVT
jgi:DNA-binding transcriptional MerR regulator